MRLFALRGAISVERNDAQDILDATTELMQRDHGAQRARARATSSAASSPPPNDLDAEFPAVAARALGFDGVPLLCAREIAVPGSMPRVIRVLIHYYAEEDHEPRHVYLRRGRSALRADLAAGAVAAQ